MKTKLHLIILSFVLLFVAGGQSVCHAADSWSYPESRPEQLYGGGDGSKWNPYKISTAQHLANLSYMVRAASTSYKGQYFVLTNDITLNDNVINEAGTGLQNSEESYQNWTPIGRDVLFITRPPMFLGTFDGQNHTIRGMVCLSSGGKTAVGLFGVLYNAAVRDIHMEDCYIKDDNADNQSYYGILCARMYEGCKINNCTVSKSVISIRSDYTTHVGGIIGMSTCNDPAVTVSNCKFDGKISVEVKDYHTFYDCEKYVGGIIGRYKPLKFSPSNNIFIKNCSSSGDIKVSCAHSGKHDEVYAGGIGGFLHAIGNVSNCVSSMNINVECPNGGLSECYVSGISCSNYNSAKVSESWQVAMSYDNCAYFGTISVGKESRAKIEEFWACGIACYWTNVSGSAFYGKFDIHCEATKTAKVASISNKYIMGSNYTNSVVYSVGNVIDFTNTPNSDIDQVCNLMADGTHHSDFYHFELSDKSTVDCKNATNKSEQYKTLDELKADGFIKNLNSYARRNLWGKITGMGEDLNGLPLPICCGGDVTGLAGQGTETDPFLITSEAELRALQKGTADGTRTTEGLYFKLTNDIYMSSEPMAPLGGYSSDYPFKGTFDGGGHAIVGMVAAKGCLFSYLAGTLKNLALVDFKASEGVDDVSPLASSVGGLYAEAGTGSAVPHTGTIENCYVTGNLKITPKTIDGRYYDGFISGICGVVHDQGKVNNCYFKGSLEVAERTDGTKPVAVFGGTGWVYGTVSNCYASYTLEKNNNTNISYSGFSTVGHDGPRSITDCYYVCPQSTYSDKLSSESELNEKFSNKSGWSQGLYRPVLTDVKSYAAKLPDGGGTKYLDAVAEPNPQPNYIVNVNINSDPYADMLVWQLPNVAVYVPSEQVDYIPNGYLDQSSEFKYKRSEGATATLGQLHFALTQNDKGTHFVCLPGEVLKSDLPEGSDAMIGGKVNIVNDEEQVNVVHVDTIPAGVPCLLYVPVSSVQSGEEIDILMRSGIVSEPVLNADYSSFKGTFTPQTVSEDACMDVAKGTAARAATRSAAQDDTYYFIRGNDDTQVKPFSSWLEGSLGNVRIVDYMLLDEYNNTNVELIESSTDDVNIKLRLTMDADKWTTICLPFDMSIDEIKEKFGEDTKLEEVESISYEGSTLNIKLGEATDGIVSGSPYFIKPSVSNSIFDFGPRILSNELAEVGNLAYSPDANQEIYLKMVGWFDISMLQSAEEFKAYYFNDGTLCQLPKDYTMILGGFRCWFKASDSTASAPAELSSVIITHSDGTITDINVVASDPQSTKQPIYDLNGIEKKSEKGIYIKGGKVRIRN